MVRRREGVGCRERSGCQGDWVHSGEAWWVRVAWRWPIMQMDAVSPHNRQSSIHCTESSLTAPAKTSANSKWSIVLVQVSQFYIQKWAIHILIFSIIASLHSSRKRCHYSCSTFMSTFFRTFYFSACQVKASTSTYFTVCIICLTTNSKHPRPSSNLLGINSWFRSQLRSPCPVLIVENNW
jgi:hypothetical protein